MKKRRSPIKRAYRPLPFAWRDQHRKIIELVARYRYLTSEQINRALGYAPTSLNSFTRPLISDLTNGHFLNFLRKPTTIDQGNTFRIHYLDRKGRAYLKALGIEAKNSPSSSDSAQREAAFFDHTLAINDVLITLNQAPAPLQLFGFMTEYEARRFLTGKGVPLPDAIAAFDIGGLCIEVDLATEQYWKVKEKAVAYKAFWDSGKYRELFQQQSLVVAFVVTRGGESRRRKLTQWLESALSEEQAQGYGGMFRVAAFDPAKLPAQELFYRDLWHVPYKAEPVPLVARR